MTSRRLTTGRLDLVSATAQHVLVALDDAGKLARLLGADLADDWPPPGIDAALLRSTLDRLHRGPAEVGWWLRYIVLRTPGESRPRLVGAIRLGGRPDTDGVVEIDVSVVPSHRALGIATEAMRALIDWTFDDEAVQSIAARPRDAAGERLVTQLGFELSEERASKTRAQWQAEGPVARRVPKLVPVGPEVAIAGLPPVARAVFERLLGEPLLGDEAMREQIREHVARIEDAARENPYVDDALARDIARVCEGLLDAVVDATPEWTRRQIQAASRYFVTEDDGDSDLAIGGLDEDAAVANAVARHLGRGDLISDLL